jgi:putative ABC transport system permease protein
MLKQIFTIILNQRKSNFWILAELLFVSVCLWYIVDYMEVLHAVKNVPLGYNIENTYKIDLNERIEGSDSYISPEEKTTTTGEDLLTITELIRRYPAIEHVSLSVASQPYVATPYSQTFYRKLIYKDTGISAQEYRVTPSFFDVFKTQAIDGKDLKPVLNAHSVIISSNMATELVKDSNAIGKNILIGENGLEKQITAECVPVRWTEYFQANNSFYTLLSDDEIAKTVNSGNLSQMELCIRVKPETNSDFIDNFIKDMAPKLMVGNIYLMDVIPSTYIRKSAVGPEESTVFVRSLLLGFLLINIFLGISGVFGLRTQQRRSELGVRIAVGSPKIKLQLLVIAEGLLLLTVVMIPVIIIAFNLGLFELVHLEWLPFTITRFITGIAITYVIMAIIILIGIWYPAYRTTKINPAEVLRSE